MIVVSDAFLISSPDSKDHSPLFSSGGQGLEILSNERILGPPEDGLHLLTVPVLGPCTI